LSGHSHIRESINYKHFGRYDDDTTALVVALKYRKTSTHPDDGHIQFESVITLLLEYGADVSVVCKGGTTALHWAIKTAVPIQTMQLILEKLPVDKINTKVDGSTALMTAVKCKVKSFENGEKPKLWKRQVLALLKYQADPYTVDKAGNSLLHQSSAAGTWLLKNLKEFDLNINRKGEHGATPLMTAILQNLDILTTYGHFDMYFDDYVEVLLEQGADISITNNHDRTAIQIAESYMRKDDYSLLLLREAEKQFQDKMAMFALGHFLSPELHKMIQYSPEKNMTP
jgi:ankyrin repeat protein